MKKKLIALVAVGALLGSSYAPSVFAKTSSKVTVVDSANRKVTFTKTPKTVATLSTGDMGIVSALGGKIVARPTSTATVSSSLKKLPQIGNTHTPNLEVIAKVKPDLLIANTGFERNVAAVGKHNTKVFISKSNSIKDIKSNISTYGKILNKASKAKEINKKITAKEKAVSKKENVKALIVYGAPGTFFAALPSSLSGDILAKAGGTNIAAKFPKVNNYPQYATLSAERVIQGNPDVIYLIAHGDPKPVKEGFTKLIKTNSAWKNLKAVKNNRIVVLPENLFAVNPGVKVTESLSYMDNSLKKISKKK